MPSEEDLLATAVGASRSRRPNDVERRIKREARFILGGGGVVVKNHTVRDVISRDRKEEVEEEETNQTENWKGGEKDRHKRRRMRCKWKKIPYPVTDDCFCSC
jgi:hypothetical protein